MHAPDNRDESALKTSPKKDEDVAKTGAGEPRKTAIGKSNFIAV